jgi:hypothetical protein
LRHGLQREGQQQQQHGEQQQAQLSLLLAVLRSLVVQCLEHW